ncbi:hypothetical protein GCM10010919_06710 [Alishewanella longhuensis]|uniref:Solute-binding protein family 3/N-terminal domain-containing protein n=2 Tax=Alishewanella longhuensis TaxID=1091037 RepID=A0ABQ3KZC0_9ALTE|nr:hypothetical protein GCM10010919_06710 [Alishewanella longhuensis]
MFDNNNVLAGGISKDILEVLVSRDQLVLQYLPIPRGRVEQWLLRDDADIACFLNPAWVEQAEQLLWSLALFSTRQVIVRRSSSPAIQKMTDLLGKRIGTDRGFSYPEFDMMFSQGLLIRDDAISLESNLGRLEKQRLDAALTVDLAFQYYQQKHDSEGLAADTLWTQPDTIYCALNPHQPELAQQIQQILQQMTEDGSIAKILQRYKPTQALPRSDN